MLSRCRPISLVFRRTMATTANMDSSATVETNVDVRPVPVVGSSTRSVVIRRVAATTSASASSSSVGVLFVPGLWSHGGGNKARFLRSLAHADGFECVTFDPEGVDQSGNIANAQDVEFKHWLEDAETALLECSSPRLVVVGSSLGGMIAIKTAIKYPERVWKLLLVCPSVNGLWPRFNTWYETLDSEAKKTVDDGHVHHLNTVYGEVPFRKSFFENARKEDLDLLDGIDVRCPVRIVHGADDDIVPFANSLDLMAHLRSTDVEVTFRKDSDHRFSGPDELELLGRTLRSMMSEAGKPTVL